MALTSQNTKIKNYEYICTFIHICFCKKTNTCAIFSSPLRSLLEDRVNRLHGQLQRTQQHLMASTDLGSVDRKVLDDLYEDIHWLILVSGQQLFLKKILKKQKRKTDLIQRRSAATSRIRSSFSAEKSKNPVHKKPHIKSDPNSLDFNKESRSACLQQKCFIKVRNDFSSAVY